MNGGIVFKFLFLLLTVPVVDDSRLPRTTEVWVPVVATHEQAVCATVRSHGSAVVIQTGDEATPFVYATKVVGDFVLTQPIPYSVTVTMDRNEVAQIVASSGWVRVGSAADGTFIVLRRSN